jgi:hypothetical protein
MWIHTSQRNIVPPSSGSKNVGLFIQIASPPMDLRNHFLKAFLYNLIPHITQLLTLKIEAVCFSETASTYMTAQYHSPEDHNLTTHQCENLETYLRF